MTKYETMLVTTAKLDEEASSALVARFTSLIEANGTIDAVEEWGKRRLAYPIQKQEEGIYTLIHFTCGPEFLAELDRVYKITDGVLRTLIVAKPDGAPDPVSTKAEEPKAAEKPAEEPAAEEAEEVEKPAEAEEAKEADKADEAAPAGEQEASES